MAVLILEIYFTKDSRVCDSVSVLVKACTQVCVSNSRRPNEGVRSLRNGVTGSCKLPEKSAQKWFQILWKVESSLYHHYTSPFLTVLIFKEDFNKDFALLIQNSTFYFICYYTFFLYSKSSHDLLEVLH